MSCGMTASTAVTRGGQEPAVLTHLNCPPKGHLFSWRPELVKQGRVTSETLPGPVVRFRRKFTSQVESQSSAARAACIVAGDTLVSHNT